MKKLTIFIVVLLVAMGAVYAFFTWTDWRKETTQHAVMTPPLPDLKGKEKEEEKRAVKIFFPSPDGRYLRAEERLLPPLKEPQALVQILVEHLLNGPLDGGYSTIPADTRLLDAYFDGQGAAYLDFSPELKQKHVPGTWAEALTVYSIVNTVAANVSGVERVYILIDGEEAETLGGHLSLRQPFSAQPRLGGAETGAR